MSSASWVLTPVRERDAVAVLLLGVLVGAMVAGRSEFAAVCVVLAGGLSWIAGARLPGRSWWVGTAWGCGLGLALNLYLVPGRPLPLPALFGRSPTEEGLAAGILIGLRVFGALLAVHGLKSAWSGDRAADVFASWLAPFERVGLPVRGLRETVRWSLRMMPAVAAEHRRIRRLQALRAGVAARGLGDRLARERAAWIPTVIAAVESAERMALAMEARHFRSRPVLGGARVPMWAVAIGLGWVVVSFFLRT